MRAECRDVQPEVRLFQATRIRSSAQHRATRERCDCCGYWFPHRKGGGACDFSSRKDYYMALRGGATIAEAMLELSATQLERLFPLERGK